MLGQIRASADLADLLSGMDVIGEIPAVQVSDVVLDSRQVAPGALFAACAGANQHGLEYAEAAAAAGACAIAWEPDGRDAPICNVPHVAVAGLSHKVGDIARKLYGHPSEYLFMVGITGTDGKTSCAWLVSRALEILDIHCGYLGTLGFGAVDDLAAATHTTPDPARLQRWLARMRADGCQAAAMEVSSHALAQKRTDSVAFDVAVLTRIGRDHLDYHGSEAAYVAAKRRLFDTDSLSWVVLNADDEVGRRWLDRPGDGVERVAYGFAETVTAHENFVRIVNVEAKTDGLVVDFVTHNGAVRVASPLIGMFNAYNLAATLAVLLAHGVELPDASEALGAVTTVPGRMERVVTGPGQPLVIVDYAHTPNALEAALDALSGHVKGRLICVFGCGGDRDRGKRALMGDAVARRTDRFWITDDNPRTEDPAAIVSDIVLGVSDANMPPEGYEIVHSRADAISAAIADAGSEDAVLIAGKGHENTQQYGSELRAFDDRVVASRALEAA